MNRHPALDSIRNNTPIRTFDRQYGWRDFTALGSLKQMTSVSSPFTQCTRKYSRRSIADTGDSPIVTARPHQQAGGTDLIYIITPGNVEYLILGPDLQAVIRKRCRKETE